MSQSTKIINDTLYCYGKVIAIFRDGYNGQLILDKKYHKWSVSTSRHLTDFCGLNGKERAKGIKSGEILLDNLN